MPQQKTENIENRRAIVSDMYLKGYQQTVIAKKVGVTQQQVSYDLKILMQQWKAEQLKNIDEMVTAELIKINKLEVEYYEAWEKSKGKDTTIKRSGKIEKPEFIQQVENSNFGDPRYLAGVQWCVNKRCELLGLNAAVKTINDNINHTVTIFELPNDGRNP